MDSSLGRERMRTDESVHVATATRLSLSERISNASLFDVVVRSFLQAETPSQSPSCCCGCHAKHNAEEGTARAHSERHAISSSMKIRAISLSRASPPASVIASKTSTPPAVAIVHRAKFANAIVIAQFSGGRQFATATKSLHRRS